MIKSLFELFEFLFILAMFRSLAEGLKPVLPGKHGGGKNEWQKNEFAFI
jgi:hypothetical protein